MKRIAAATLVLALCSSTAAAKRPEPATEAQTNAAGQAYIACVREAIREVDDGISDAATIGRSIAPLCLKELETYSELYSRDLSPGARRIFLSYEYMAKRAIERATAIVLIERQKRSEGGRPDRAEAPRGKEESGPSVGTGFFVGPNGDILTSYHVVEGAEQIGCRTRDGTIHPATVSRISAANDLALLHVNFKPSSYLGLAARGSARTGDRVFTIGYGAPSFLGISEPRFTEGTISALSGAGAEDAYMQISVPVQPGNSGGPLLNEQGQVVGVVAAQAAVGAFLKAVGTLPQSINWAVKSDYAAPLMANLPTAPKRTREQAIRVAESALCLIIAGPGDTSPQPLVSQAAQSETLGINPPAGFKVIHHERDDSVEDFKLIQPPETAKTWSRRITSEMYFDVRHTPLDEHVVFWRNLIARFCTGLTDASVKGVVDGKSARKISFHCPEHTIYGKSYNLKMVLVQGTANLMIAKVELKRQPTPADSALIDQLFGSMRVCDKRLLAACSARKATGFVPSS
jgi:S1-C subfamily serine protease